MPKIKLFHLCSILAGFAGMRASAARGETTAAFTTLHTFSAYDQAGTGTDNADGAAPNAALLLGRDGNFYGTTQFGGANGDGTVFKITPAGLFTTLHSFNGGDGQRPYCSLFQDANGDFFGTTFSGGKDDCGTIFKMTAAGGLTTLHSFSGTGSEGSGPEPRLIQDGAGNFYGTTYEGGTYGFGTIFKCSASGKLSTLHSFDGNVTTDGSGPTGGLTLAKDGNFYGTAGGGTNADGTIYRLTPAGGFNIVHDFTQVNDMNANTDGRGPNASLTLGSNGDLYGTAISGGTGGAGTVFRFTTGGGFATLHSFATLSEMDTNSGGGFVYSGVIQGRNGDFYGMTNRGGPGGNGAIFQITPAGAVTTLHLFGGANPDAADPDGAEPRGNLVLGSDGSFYGTTSAGGGADHGTIFRLSIAPAITSATTATATVDKAFSYLIKATNDPTSFNATGLPSGVSVDKKTGLISGSPASTASGVKTIHLSASNATGTGTATLTLTIGK